ncbi:MAG: hypothetical protein ABJA98_35655 [Acidobacteriota bacterium]
MTFTFHALWMLCGLSAAVFATYIASATTTLHETAAASERTALTPPTLRWRGGRLVASVALACGFGLTSWWVGSGRPVDAAWAGGLVAAVAATQLVLPRHPAYLSVASGALAALWASLLHVQGLPQPIAMASGAALPIASAYLSLRTPAFAPPLLQEEGLVAVLAIGIMVAVLPAVAQGWQSAIALNLADKGASLPQMPAWLMSFVGASMILGALSSLWRRG